MNDYLSREECKAIQIKILDAIVAICNAHQLQYYLAYGTLLGAIRHKGFIPWDDDIDIYLPRDDYDKLAAILKNAEAEKPDWLEYYDGDKPGYYYPFAKAVDNTTIAKMEDNLTQHGVWIDLFPIDGIPENDSQQKKYVKRGKFLRDIAIAMTTDFSASKGGLKMIAKRAINSLAALIGRKKIYEKTIRYYKRYKSTDSTKVACMCGAYGIKDIHSRKEMFTPTYVAFEGKEYQATRYWDEYLRHLYGDYMQLPSEDQRKIHSITAWRITNI